MCRRKSFSKKESAHSFSSSVIRKKANIMISYVPNHLLFYFSILRTSSIAIPYLVLPILQTVRIMLLLALREDHVREDYI